MKKALRNIMYLAKQVRELEGEEARIRTRKRVVFMQMFAEILKLIGGRKNV